jgi:hypothetical protein
MRRIARSWPIAVVVAIFIALPAASNADTMTVAPPIATNSAWNSNGWPLALNGFSMNLNVGSAGNFMWIRTQRLPANVNLDAFYFNANWHNAYSGAEPFAVRMCYHGVSTWNATTGSCSGDQYARLEQSTPVARTTANLGMGCGIQNANISADYHCSSFQFEVAVPQSAGDATLATNSATISDYTPPVISTNYGSQTLNSSSWLRGTVQAGANVTDVEGVGVNSVSLFIDGNLKSTQSYTCSTSQWIPCAQNVQSAPSVNTTSYIDGPHSAFFRATDPTANQGQSATFNFRVDNTKPDTPTDIQPETNGQDGWASTNEFGASWTNGAEVDTTATQSGLDRVIVDVNPTTALQSDPAPINIPIGTSVSGVSATNESVSGLSVPAVGAWTLRLQLVDKAGNVSDVGGATGSDTTIGYDPSPPAAPQGQANGWISRDELAAGFHQEFTYSAPPVVAAPVCGFAGAVDKNINGTAGSTINVPGGGDVRSWQLPGTLDEDTHYVHLRAVGCNGAASTVTETVAAAVDRTDPIGTISGVENGRWYKDGQMVELRGSDALSGMVPAPPTDPRASNGAYLSYDVNGSGPIADLSPRGDSASIPITGEGQKELRFAPVDLAGNRSAPRVATFGIDATNPTGYINDQDPVRPTLLSAKLSDATSGVAYAVFFIRPVGGGDTGWIQLPTSIVGVNGDVIGSAATTGIATARFPDVNLARGTYDVRVAAFDQAGNAPETNRLQDGSIARIENPLRAATGVSMKLFKALRECKKSANGKMRCSIKKCTRKTKGVCYKVLRGKVVLKGGSSVVTSAYNRGAIATGILTDDDGSALKNTEVTVSTTSKTSGISTPVAIATTDSRGIWAIRIPAGVSRIVVATYEGSETRRPSTSSATINTQAKLALTVSKKRVQTGQTIIFSGKVTPFDSAFPSGGKIVALQFFAANKWRPAVGVGHTDKNGKFKIKYKFDGLRVKAKIIFRVTAPSEDAWGHVYSVSRPVRIELN